MPLLAVLSATGLSVLATLVGRRKGLLAAVLIVATFHLLVPHLKLAISEVRARRVHLDAVERSGIDTGVVFLMFGDEAAWKRHPIPPPADLTPGAGVVFAADLGPRNAELLQRLGNPPAWRWSSTTRRLEPLTP